MNLGEASAQAGLTIEKIRTDLVNENFDALEKSFTEEFERALAEKDFSNLRKIYAVLFGTANVERLGRLQKWQLRFPDSQFATTALAWTHYVHAHMKHGDVPSYLTNRKNYENYQLDLAKAWELTGEVVKDHQTFVPAMDLAVQLYSSKGYEELVPAYVNLILKVAPDQQSINLGLKALTTTRHASIKEIVSICTRLAAKVPDYSTKLCLIEAAFKNHAKGYLRKKALEALENSDAAFLDYARLNAYLNEWSDHPNALDEIKRIHRAMLDPTTNIAYYRSLIDQIDQIFGTPLYRLEAEDALLREMRDRLQDSPENYRIRKFLIEDILDRYLRKDPTADIAEAQVHWQRMHVFGERHSVTWDIGARLEINARGAYDFSEVAKYHATSIYYNGNSAGAIRTRMLDLFYLHRTAIGEWGVGDTVWMNNGEVVDLETIAELLKCPMFRAQRLYTGLCRIDPNNWICNVSGADSDVEDRIIRLMAGTNECPWVRHAEIEELYYQPHFRPTRVGTY